MLYLLINNLPIIIRKLNLSHIEAKKITINRKELSIALSELYHALVSIDEKNTIIELAGCKHNQDFLGEEISIELYAKLKDMAADVINMPSSWSGDLEEAMRIDILTSKIEPLWEEFDAEWKNYCN